MSAAEPSYRKTWPRLRETEPSGRLGQPHGPSWPLPGSELSVLPFAGLRKGVETGTHRSGHLKTVQMPF